MPSFDFTDPSDLRYSYKSAGTIELWKLNIQNALGSKLCLKSTIMHDFGSSRQIVWQPECIQLDTNDKFNGKLLACTCTTSSIAIFA